MSQKKIYFKNQDSEMSSMIEAEYESEEIFQKLLADFPDILAGGAGQYDETRRWLLVAQEAPIPDKSSTSRWFLDHFFIDQDSIPTLVEVKRRSDTRLRREVIGQMFDYAAHAATYWTEERLENLFQETCKSLDQDPDQLLIEHFADEDDAQSVWKNVFDNLHTNRMRLVFVADDIQEELARIIEFMNETMPTVEAMGIEVKQYVGNNQSAYVPTLVGYTATAAAQKKESGKGPGETWNAERFKAKLEESGIAGLSELFDLIVEWADQKLDKPLWWGRGRMEGSFAAPMLIGGEKIWPVYFYTGQKGTGYVQVGFQGLSKIEKYRDDSKRLELLRHINQVLGVSISEEKVNAWPSFPLAVLLDKDKLVAFKNIVESLDSF